MQPDNNSADSPRPSTPPETPAPSPTDEQLPAPNPVVTLTPDEPTVATSDVVVEEAPSSEPAPPLEPVHWQAHEYIHHDKSPLWFVIFVVVVIAFIAAAIFLIKSITFAILVPVMAAALLMYTHRPPRLLDYTLSNKGLYVNDHLYSFSEFKAFGVVRDGEEYSIMLLPVKRFMPEVSVYFPEEAGEAIVDMLGSRLPMQEFHLNFVDKIIRKLRI